MYPARVRFLFTLRDRLSKNRSLVILFLAALAVRLLWNLKIHPPLDYVYSDMGGYMERATTRLDHPGERFPYFTLFPWGTHVLLSLVKATFGRTNGAAIGIVYALFGALAVAYTAAVAGRLTRRPWIVWTVGAILVLHYPWISLGGYALSEPPFTFFLSAATFHALRLADRPRPLDAWLFGVSVALGAIFRPQILVSLVLLAPLLVIHRGAFRRLLRPASLRLLPAIAVPIALIFALSAWRMHFHTGELGLISSNGPLNYAFGRCHALSISARAPDRKSGYSPTSLGGLAKYEETHKQSLFKVDPAMGKAITFDGHIWDGPPLRKIAANCVKKTGIWRQVKYAITHVVLLWGYNVVWPDMGQKPEFRRPMEISGTVSLVAVLPGAVAGFALSLRRRRERHLLVALQVWSLLVVAMLYFGDSRLRVPYDGILLLLAVYAYASGVSWIRLCLRAPHAGPAEPPGEPKAA